MNKQNKTSKIVKIVVLLIVILVVLKIGQVLIYSYNEGEANRGRAESYREYVKDSKIATTKLENTVYPSSQKYDWCISNGGRDATPNFNAPKVCVLKNRVYEDKCVGNDKYYVISKELTDSVGSDILVKYKTSLSQKISCKYSKQDTDFEIKNKGGAQYVLALEGNYLIIDEGTAPEPRGLVIYDLIKKKKVYDDLYSKPIVIIDNKVSYWTNTSEKVTKENCPTLEVNNSHGLGSAIDAYVTLDLLTLSKTDSGQRRCSVRQ